jgi:hypothetical protein
MSQKYQWSIAEILRKVKEGMILVSNKKPHSESGAIGYFCFPGLALTMVFKRIGS